MVRDDSVGDSDEHHLSRAPSLSWQPGFLIGRGLAPAPLTVDLVFLDVLLFESQLFRRMQYQHLHPDIGRDVARRELGHDQPLRAGKPRDQATSTPTSRGVHKAWKTAPLEAGSGPHVMAQLAVTN